MAPGFRLENVFVMAGVPKVMQAMMEAIGPTLSSGPKVESRTIEFLGGEGDVAKGLSEIQKLFPGVGINDGHIAVNITGVVHHTYPVVSSQVDADRQPTVPATRQQTRTRSLKLA